MNTRLPYLLAALTLFLTAAGHVIAADIDAESDSANKLYEQGKYADATREYEKLVKTGSVSPALYYNFGNALFKSGQLGRAIAAYRQAEAMTPRDPELRANLQFARNRVQGPTFKASVWENWLNKFTLNEWTSAGVIMIWLTFGLLIVRQLWPATRNALRNWTFLSAAAAILICSCLGCALAHRTTVQTVVVDENEVAVRTGPFDESQTAFTAHDGAELRVLDKKNDWLQVGDGKRLSGWIKASDVALTGRS